MAFLVVIALALNSSAMLKAGNTQKACAAGYTDYYSEDDLGGMG